MKTDVDRLLLVLKMKKQFPKSFVELNYFLFYKPNLVYLRSLLSSLPFLKFKKQNFMYYWHISNLKSIQFVNFRIIKYPQSVRILHVQQMIKQIQRSFYILTKLHKCPLGTQSCDRNSGEPGPACPAVACRRRLLVL